MPVTVVATIRTKPGRAGEILDRLREILPGTRGYPGCLGVDVVQDMDDENTIVILEEWDARSDHEAYREWRREEGTGLGRFADAFAEPPAMAYYEQRRDIHWG